MYLKQCCKRDEAGEKINLGDDENPRYEYTHFEVLREPKSDQFYPSVKFVERAQANGLLELDLDEKTLTLITNDGNRVFNIDRMPVTAAEVQAMEPGPVLRANQYLCTAA